VLTFALIALITALLALIIIIVALVYLIIIKIPFGISVSLAILIVSPAARLRIHALVAFKASI